MEIKVWDNGGKSTDRYTVKIKYYRNPRETSFYGMGSDPVYGFNQYVGEMVDEGPHLGKRVDWFKLPECVRKAILGRVYMEGNQ